MVVPVLLGVAAAWLVFSPSSPLWSSPRVASWLEEPWRADKLYGPGDIVSYQGKRYRWMGPGPAKIGGIPPVNPNTGTLDGYWREVW